MIWSRRIRRAQLAVRYQWPTTDDCRGQNGGGGAARYSLARLREILASAICESMTSVKDKLKVPIGMNGWEATTTLSGPKCLIPTATGSMSECLSTRFQGSPEGCDAEAGRTGPRTYNTRTLAGTSIPVADSTFTRRASATASRILTERSPKGCRLKPLPEC